MDWALVGIQTFILFLIVSAYLSFNIAKQVMRKTQTMLTSLVSAYTVNFVFHIFLIFVWLYYCFNVPLGWSIETFPVAGILLGFGSAIFSSVIITIVLIFLRPRLLREFGTE